MNPQVSRETDVLKRVAAWCGHPLSRPGSQELLLTFAEWLRTEGLAAGGLGPREGGDILGRHLADALAFAVGWRSLPAPPSLVDVGSGVGLPGIPLAVLWPQTRVTLVDRSGRRVRLARRAVRVLGLANVEVEQAEVAELPAEVWAAATMRAVLPPDQAVGQLLRLLAAGGRGVLALSRRQAPRQVPPVPEGWAAEVAELPSAVLDPPAWLLIMAPL